MSVFGSILGGLGTDVLASLGLGGAADELGNHLSSARSVSNQKEIMNYSDQLQRQWSIDQYGLMRQGLEKAGMNPLMMSNTPSTSEAISAGSGFAGENSAKSAMDSKSQMFGFAKSLLEMKNLKANTAQSETKTKLIEEQTKKVQAEIKNLEQDLKVKEQAIKQMQANIDKLRADIANNKKLTDADVAKKQEEIRLMEQKKKNMEKEKDEIEQRISKLQFTNSSLMRSLDVGSSVSSILSKFVP